VNSELGAAKKPKSEGNLNRLDPTTRVVGGVRERKSVLKFDVEIVELV
jgi:hypothetical protein